MKQNMSKPFNNLPLLPPAVNLETVAVMKETVSHYLKELERIGIFVSVKKGREIYYIFSELVSILSGN